MIKKKTNLQKTQKNQKLNAQEKMELKKIYQTWFPWKEESILFDKGETQQNELVNNNTCQVFLFLWSTFTNQYFIFFLIK